MPPTVSTPLIWMFGLGLGGMKSGASAKSCLRARTITVSPELTSKSNEGEAVRILGSPRTKKFVSSQRGLPRETFLPFRNCTVPYPGLPRAA